MQTDTTSSASYDVRLVVLLLRSFTFSSLFDIVCICIIGR